MTVVKSKIREVPIRISLGIGEIKQTLGLKVSAIENQIILKKMEGMFTFF